MFYAIDFTKTDFSSPDYPFHSDLVGSNKDFNQLLKCRASHTKGIFSGWVTASLESLP